MWLSWNLNLGPGSAVRRTTNCPMDTQPMNRFFSATILEYIALDRKGIQINIQSNCEGVFGDNYGIIFSSSP